ncbi:MAG: HlyD family type I secretion periplasmic adaptor subunit [Rhodocyclaceae bacterium]|nr:HlyD family type I secretion periplasmic adaptor subunit [Rhodocyclaceae bacterium]
MKGAVRVIDGAAGEAEEGRGRPGAVWLRQRSPDDRLDWVGDAEWARLSQEPVRARGLLYAVCAIVVLLVGWAAVAEVDEVTRGEARVVPSSQLQVVQSVDGGVVERLLVREGQIVEPGELLFRVDPTRFVSSMRESRAELLALQVRAARLEALTRGEAFVVDEMLLREVPEIVAEERRLYESRRAELAAQQAIAGDQLNQRRQEANEARARYAQASSGLALVQKELDTTRPLIGSGAVSEVEVLRLQRELARLRGERDQAAAQVSRLESAIAEATSKVQEVELVSRNQMRNELTETLGRMSSMTEGARSLEDRVRHAEIRSPVRGTIKRLLVTTPGAVVQPGQSVAEIVPLDDALIVEALIKPQDIAFLRPGQEAMVKFTAYDFAIYGGLQADVEQISADTVTDDKGGVGYLVRLRTRQAGLGDDMPIIPGMLAQVDVRTGKKTVLAYVLKPVLRAKANALSER